MASKCSSDRKSCMSLVLNKKLEMIKLSEKGCQKLKLAKNEASGAKQPKEKFMKGVKSATPVNTQMIRRQN